MIGKRIRLYGNQVGVAILLNECGRQVLGGRSTYASGTECIVVGEKSPIPEVTPGHLDVRVCGTDHVARFNRQRITADVLE